MLPEHSATRTLTIRRALRHPISGSSPSHLIINQRSRLGNDICHRERSCLVAITYSALHKWRTEAECFKSVCSSGHYPEGLGQYQK